MARAHSTNAWATAWVPPANSAAIHEASGQLAHSITQPEGWRIWHAVAAAAGAEAMRTPTNAPALLLRCHRLRSAGHHALRTS
jgi:hypothetical protein